LTLIAFALIASVPAGAVTGAGFTTFDTTLKGCLDNKTGIDCNNYADKLDVFVNGGPTAGGVGNGCYYFSVLVPGSQNGGFVDGATGNLSDVAPTSSTGAGDIYTNRIFHVSNHVIDHYADAYDATTCGYASGGYAVHQTGTDPQGNFVIQLMPYDDTTNPGGVYILAVCTVDSPVPSPAGSPSECKYDAFRAPPSFPPPPPSNAGFLTVCKYYDTNANGSCDGSTPGTCSTTSGGDSLIAWDFQYSDGVSDLILTDNNSCTTVEVPADSYTVQEGIPTQTNWYNTQPGPNPTKLVPGQTVITQAAPVVAGGTTEVDFGNYCVGAGGGLTLGYWSNKNGQATMGCSGSGGNKCTAELSFKTPTYPQNLCLFNGNGTQVNPFANYTAFKNWILSATATNMAYMSSAQLAAMELNVLNGSVNSTSLVQTGPDPDNCASDPGVSGWSNQTISVSNLMAAENAELCSSGGNVTINASHLRTCEQFWKNALDSANNNLNFVQGQACSTTFDLNPADTTTYSFPQ